MASKSRKEQIQDMLANDPNDPELRYFLAMEHQSCGEEEDALKCFQELMASAPDYVPTYVQAGQLLNRLQREDEARQVYRNGIAAARKKGDRHAAEEMEAFLDSIS
jgi:tetratricopeptide (TPR) repeat protein